MIGIEQKRFAAAVEQILKEELQKGNLPSSKEFGLRLTQYLQSQNLGRPEYEFKRFRNGAVAYARDYNEIVTKIQKDLTILYENTIALHDELNGKFNWFETEKNKVEYEARKLENELVEKINLYGKTGYLASAFDVFDDLSKVSVQDNVVVDVKKHEVTLKQEENTSFQFKPDGSLVFQMPKTSEGTFKRIPLTGSPSNILSTYSNDIWQEIWLSKERGPAAGYLEYNFTHKEAINRIEFDVQTIKACTVMIEFTPDEVNWFHLPYYEEGLTTTSKVSFDFPTIEIKTLRIWIQKTEHDGEIVHPEGYAYQYVFGAKSLSLYQLRYPEVGTFTSTDLTPVTTGAFSIGKVSLVVNEEIPVGTDIEYAISVDNENWREISPVNRDNPISPQLIDFKYVTNAPAQSLGIPSGINTEEYELTELTANGIAFYQIGSIEKKQIIDKTERLYAGKNAWIMKSTPKNYGGAHIPSLEDWFNPEDEVTTTFQNMELGKPSVLMQGLKHSTNKQYYFGLGIFCAEKEKVFTTTPASTEPIAIFLNGAKIYEGVPNASTQVNYVLKNGWNDIVVLAYIQKANTANGSTIDIGFDPTNLSSSIYASSKPLEKVSLFDLQYNIKNNDWNKFAFYEKEDKTYIVLNYGISGIKYDLFFNYVDEEVVDKIKLKATLRQFGKGTYTTPKLKKYTLQFS